MNEQDFLILAKIVHDAINEIIINDDLMNNNLKLLMESLEKLIRKYE